MLSIFEIFLEGHVAAQERCAQEAQDANQDGAAYRDPRSRGRIKEGYISLQVAKSLEDRRV